MQRNLYVVYDKVANDTIGPIIQYNHDAPAVRTFSEGLADPQGLGRHPQDFDLLLVGRINTDAGEFAIDVVPPTLILSGAAWLAAQPSREK